MPLKEEAKKIMNELVSSEVAAQLDSFENPKLYPKDFLDECEHFLGLIVGEEVAKKRFYNLRKKYAK